MNEPLIVSFAAALVASATFMVATVLLMGDTAFKRSADTLSATLTVALISAAFAYPIFPRHLPGARRDPRLGELRPRSTRTAPDDGDGVEHVPPIP